MKTSYSIGIAVLIIILLAAGLVVLGFNQPTAATSSLAASALRAQATLSPVATDRSEVGSTDGIIIMGVVIVAIISVPLAFRKKRKSL